jgi:hypothetical protein
MLTILGVEKLHDARRVRASVLLPRRAADPQDSGETNWDELQGFLFYWDDYCTGMFLGGRGLQQITQQL